MTDIPVGAVPKEPPIARDVQTLHKNVAALAQAVAQLESKLSPVLAPVPSSGDDAALQQSGSSELSRSIATANIGLAQVYDRVLAITRSVEV